MTVIRARAEQWRIEGGGKNHSNGLSVSRMEERLLVYGGQSEKISLIRCYLK